jgi:hypothetical protein
MLVLRPFPTFSIFTSDTFLTPRSIPRFHDLRHWAITLLAENRTSDLTIMAIAVTSAAECWSGTATSAWKQSETQWKPSP